MSDLSRSRAGNVLPRLLFHLAFILCFVLAAGALLIWPQWLAVDGVRNAVSIQRNRADELQQRLDAARSMMSRLRLWEDTGRRVFLREEAHQFPRLVRAIAQRYGLGLENFRISPRRARRWTPLTLESNMDGTSGGEVQPRTVHLTLVGSFEGIYSSVSALCEQQQLFIPERWSVFPVNPAAGEANQALRVELQGTIFLIEEPEGSSPSLLSRPDAAEGDQ